MINYKCTAWARNADGSREPQATETIPESELSGVFVAGSRAMGLASGQVNVPAWLACCEFARRMGLDPAVWQLPGPGIGYRQNSVTEARLAAQLPVIIRVEEVP